MGILDDLAIGQSSPFPGFLNLPDGAVFPPVLPKKDDDTKKSDDARARLAQSLLDANAYGGGATAGVSVPPAPDQSSPAVQYALGNIAPTANPVDTLPLTPAQQQMMAMVGGGTPVPKPITIQPPFGALAPSMPAPTQTAQTSVPMPQPRPATAPVAAAAAPQADEAALPPNATPTQGQSSPVAAPQEPSLLSKIGDKLNQNSNLLIGMGAGFAGAPSIGTGISRALTGASSGSQLDLKQAMQQGAIGPTYTALVKAGVPKEQALAAVYNPEILKAVTQTYITDRKSEIKTVKDALGNERLVSVNPYDNTSKAIDAGTAGTTSVPSNLEPNYDPVTKRDEAFLKSLDPTTAAAVKDIADGNMSGTGRNLQKLMPYVARYEQGFSNGTYTSRNKFNTELGSQSSSTVGGQKTLMGTSLGHLADASESAAAMNNSDGAGSADAAHLYNAMANRTTANAAKANKLNDNVAKFSGEIGKLYSGSSGGGVHEREESRGRLGQNLSRAELAAGLESNRDLILSKQQALEQHATDLFGPEGAKKYDFIGPEGRSALARIETSIAKLKGTALPAAASSAAAAPPPSTGKTASGIAWSVQ